MQQNKEEENNRQKDAAPTTLMASLVCKNPTQAILKSRKAGRTRRLQKKNAISKDTGLALKQNHYLIPLLIIFWFLVVDSVLN